MTEEEAIALQQQLFDQAKQGAETPDLPNPDA